MGISIKYPRVAAVTPYKSHPKTRPKCSKCSERATHKSTIEVDNVRKNNKFQPRCLRHKWS